MKMTETGFYLDSFLAPLSPWLGRQDVTDIYVNRPGEVWIETIGGKTERHENDTLTEQLLARLSRQIAAHGSQGISRAQPLLAATLPDGSRIQIVAPPATRAGHALAIRRHVKTDFSLADWEASEAFDALTEGDATIEQERQWKSVG